MKLPLTILKYHSWYQPRPQGFSLKKMGGAGKRSSTLEYLQLGESTFKIKTAAPTVGFFPIRHYFLTVLYISFLFSTDGMFLCSKNLRQEGRQAGTSSFILTPRNTEI